MIILLQSSRSLFALLGMFFLATMVSHATPANRAALQSRYGLLLSEKASQCTACHLPSNNRAPENLDEFPHNLFGDRLRALGRDLKKNGKSTDLSARLATVAREDSDSDGVANEIELLLGHNPGNPKDLPSKTELATVKNRQKEFKKFLATYQWRPFEPARSPAIPRVKSLTSIRNPIDAFIAAEHQTRGLKPRPEASKEILVRRVYLDLIGLSPTPEEINAFVSNRSARAYEDLVEALLNDPRYGERWARHWMDIWRYSDWAGWSGGNQIRDSQPHIWRWRDWIIESLNNDKGYDQMLMEMLAADELHPADTNALRATGFLVRNYKMLSREQWLEDTVKHTSQAFLGLTVGCAKCHDHMTDPISQKEYYQFRAIFEPHQVRIDRVPGELDTLKNGLVRAYDVGTNAPTYFFVRGDERRADTNRLMTPSVPKVLGGRFEIEPVALPSVAAFPDKRAFVIEDTIRASEKALEDAKKKLEKIQGDKEPEPEKIKEQELAIKVAEAKQASLLAVLHADQLDDEGKNGSESWTNAAITAAQAQAQQALQESRLALHQAQVAERAAKNKLATNSATEATPETDTEKLKKIKADQEKAVKEHETAKKKLEEAEKSLASAQSNSQNVVTTNYKPRSAQTFPINSTGRRLAFARWVATAENPLTARVAVNHLWLRHFGKGLVPTPADFGRSGKSPPHPQLLDWLAAEFMARNWSMKDIHRLILTSSTYRRASSFDPASAAKDPDNVFLWRMPSRRMEAELVRDNLLHISKELDPTRGGPEVDHQQGLTSKRRSVYLRNAAEKEVEFLKIFDGPSVTECYLRHPTVVPQQALALINSELAMNKAQLLAEKLSAEFPEQNQFVREAFLRVLARQPREEEVTLCRNFLEDQAKKQNLARARQNLALVLFNHNDFVTIR